ncbi:MAG: glycosyltransferase [Ignavibacteria bacterium]|nr:glycosyltransferase [Ignavibacteria bacterium]MBI3766058.1 glycosyltransferase [Ignavibacteriales bacterium]
MSTHPQISIIIPTLQEEKILAQTLDQFTPALRQQFNLEVIVSDGGSTDGTLAIARERSDVVIEHAEQTRQTISAGRNRGAAVAHGGILVFLNADVMIEEPEKFFSTMVRVMGEERVAAATCNVNIYPEEERLSDWLFHNFFNGYFWLLNVLGLGIGRGECHIVRKKVFEEGGRYNEKIAAGEDVELFRRLGRRGTIIFVRTLTVFESPRRFRKYGYLWIIVLWILNDLGVVFARRSIVDHWKPVR